MLVLFWKPFFIKNKSKILSSIEVKELSKIKEDIKQSVDNPDMGLSVQVEIKKRDSATNKLWVHFKLGSTFGCTIR